MVHNLLEDPCHLVRLIWIFATGDGYNICLHTLVFFMLKCWLTVFCGSLLLFFFFLTFFPVGEKTPA